MINFSLNNRNFSIITDEVFLLNRYLSVKVSILGDESLKVENLSIGPFQSACTQFQILKSCDGSIQISLEALFPNEVAFNKLYMSIGSNYGDFVPKLHHLANDLVCSYESNQSANIFRDLAKGGKLLDIGGRNRSKIDRSKEFPSFDVTVLDILDGDNVDVVADAHMLSDYFPPNCFDAVFSAATFEHLAMPWKVALEINNILRPEGIVYVMSHQSMYLHDQPCDYFRFSDVAWHSIFNYETGFEVLQTFSDFPVIHLPKAQRFPVSSNASDVGHEVSIVIAKKIGNTKLNWNVDTNSITKGQYPSGLNKPRSL